MFIQQAALSQGLLGKERVTQMREGEVFPAKVVKMLPNGMAELSTGTTTMIAKLEVPLQSGERYWFRVVSNAEQLQLNVVTSPAAAKGDVSTMARSLLLQLSLPLTEENRAFVEMMMKENRPLSKEAIVKAAEWLAKGSVTEGIQVIKMMAERSLPLTKDVFQSLMTAQSPATISKLTEGLINQLHQLKQPSDSANTLLKLLKEWQSPLEKHTVQRVLSAVMDQLLFSEKTAAARTPAVDLVKSWGMIPEKAESIDDMLVEMMRQWKKEGGQPPDIKGQMRTESGSMSLKEVISQFIHQPSGKEPQQRLENALMQSTRTADKGVSQSLTEEIKQLMAGLKDVKATNEQLAAIFKTAAKVSIHQEQPQEAIRQLASLFNKEADELMNAVKNEGAKIHSSAIITSLTGKEILFQKVAFAVENDMRLHLSAKEAHAFIKDTFQLLGVDLEGLLQAGKAEQAELESMLKPQLLRLLSENIPIQVRELAEQLIGRMNVQQLLSAEQGPLQQLVMQVPVNLFGFHTELTLQWSGKRTASGKLDADYCRVLFYLNLEQLKETVIDMQVQNRIIQLQVFNETPGLKAMAEALIPALKAGIEEKGYQLSSVQFKQPKKDAQLPLVQVMKALPYEGVDIRI
ncbi:hypothetical protein QYG89_04675 [Bacillus sp. B190/17]|uniref:Flagellar hook-length control protein FliK n=1 Tax=Bacillus lumedeiriae TaxID=3058829 RepID=A0ABW8I6Y6_9BACI